MRTTDLKDGGLRRLGPGILLGRVAAWSAGFLVTLLLGCWLFMEKSTLRDALVLGCAVVLAVLALSAWVLRRASGNPDPAMVYRALAARSSTTLEEGPKELPARLRSTSALLNGQALTFYGGVMALILPLALGVGTPTPTGKAAEIASAGVVVRVLPVVSVRDVVRDRHKNGSTYFCTVTVTLPPADGSGSGRRVDFRSEWSDPAEVGRPAYVAYAPDRPGLGAVGDDDRASVDRELTGRAMDNWWTGILGSLWLVLLAGLLLASFTGRRDQRFPRRLRGDERVLRAGISGYDGYGSGKARIRLSTSAGPMQLRVEVDNARYVDAVGGAEGHLVWVPDRNRHGGRKGPHRTGAVFISDAGWFIPGGIAPEDEEPVRAAVAEQHVPVAPSGEGRLLNLDAGWLLSIPNHLMNVLLLWTLGVLMLAVPVPSAAWRLVVGIACTVGLLAYGMYLVGKQDTVVRSRSGDRRDAAGSAA
ncbi:hypothetical protein [Streptomyces sp. NBC_01304]|uniref:hypothetical protein n=1 Tax=Streptomyces sp. NBC_01304 TaxID=2903818 RepID=UPI002E12FF6D|nr:hypothetical protein OG430_15335 [Streptomyces sp. NBC_01304]